MSLHPFDAALQLQPQADGSYLGTTSPAWANMVGPFGGITAATVVHAIVGHDKCLGSPVALTLNYVAAIADGAFRLLPPAHRIVDACVAAGLDTEETTEEAA